MLKQVRQNSVVNKAIRKIIRIWGNNSIKYYRKLSNKWRTSGITSCEFDGIDFKMYNECDDNLVELFYYKNSDYQESQDLRSFLPLAKVSKVIVDIGANTGLYSILSSKVNSGSRIYAIEPYITNYLRLQKNLEINNICNVDAINVAFGENCTPIKFSVPKTSNITDVSSVNGSFSRSMYPELEWSEVIVEMLTLDQLAHTVNRRINLIKCDVETYEVSVFKGADFVLQAHKPTILFESFMDEERKLFFNEVLSRYNYHAYLILKEGVVRIDNGFDSKSTGLNYFISPVKSSENFISHQRLSVDPNQLLLFEL